MYWHQSCQNVTTDQFLLIVCAGVCIISLFLTKYVQTFSTTICSLSVVTEYKLMFPVYNHKLFFCVQIFTAILVMVWIWCWVVILDCCNRCTSSVSLSDIWVRLVWKTEKVAENSHSACGSSSLHVSSF